MVLKRKRSESEISTSSSLLSSPLSASNFMPIDSQPQIATPSLFASRTRKRYRDNRPAESEVHQHTLSLLFSAQQRPPQSSLPTSFRPSSHAQKPVSAVPSSQPSQQASLHSFWHGPMTASSTRHSSPSSTYSASPVTTPGVSPGVKSMFPATNCEDCDASLGASNDLDAMDVDVMDMDIGMVESHACTACGKYVCHGCSVSNLGAERKCLNCAGRKTGAFGFANR
ncbi:hypothetical protein LZ554_004102 [Drepanopeziza brunnea f. sp. 'monogermtubi']|nr:hypothetical protein LZ554_004102 [Drepanopeziza brunnea f. sp. 'monogermtubi']